MSNEVPKRSLRDDLELPRPDQLYGPCKFRIVKEKMDDEDQQSIDLAVEKVRQDKGQGKAKAYSAKWLTSVLRKHGHNISVSTVQRHVNKECPCERIV